MPNELAAGVAKPSAAPGLRPAAAGSLPPDVTELSARLAAVVLVALLGVRLSFTEYSVPIGLLSALAFVPVWLPHLRRCVGGSLVTGLTLATLLWSVLLAWATLTYGTHSMNTRGGGVIVVRLVALVAFMGVLIWARSILKLSTVAIVYGSSALVTGLPAALGSPNPWKYVLSVPVTILALGIAMRYGDGWRAIGTCVALAAVGVAADSRSYAAFVLAGGMLVFVCMTRRSSRVRWRRGYTVVFAAAGAFVAYFLATSLLVGGALGGAVATRTQQQLDQAGGNLLVGGRPEWLASINLMQMHPFGLGLGAVPDDYDVAATKDGLRAAGVTTYPGYVRNYMMKGTFRLHSIMNELFMNAGWVGMALAVTMLVLLGYTLVTAISVTKLSSVQSFLILMGLWNVLFGSLFSNILDVAVSLGMCLAVRSELRAARRARAAQRARRETLADSPDPLAEPTLLAAPTRTKTGPAQ